MNSYQMAEDKYIIDNFDGQKNFFGFLPGIAGIKGKPLWAFYCNKGQGITSFGVADKEHAISEFDSAIIALQKTELTSFRTFLKIDGKSYNTFRVSNGAKKSMEIKSHAFTVKEKTDKYKLAVEYFCLPEENFSALMRKTQYTNTTNATQELEILDGLPVALPYGLTNSSYKFIPTLSQSFIEIANLENKIPYFKQKTTADDEAKVSELKSGNFYLAYSDGKLLDVIVDTAVIFGKDTTFDRALCFEDSTIRSLLKEEQVLENKIPCMFGAYSKSVAANETVTIYSIIGFHENVSVLNREAEKIVAGNFFDEKEKVSRLVTEELLKPISTKTGNPIFDAYTRQCFLDNGVRGGFFHEINGVPLYLYSRKHGDPERDYNNFFVPPQFFSSGEGNFRDMNQNRRSDVLFYPESGAYNIKLFYELVQLDGYNPLLVKPDTYRWKDGERTVETSISEMLNRADTEKEFNKIMSSCERVSNAAFGEGYWSDHFSYSLDLIESYLSVYPEKQGELLDIKLRYFDSGVFVEPRSRKYTYEDGKVRQYYAVDTSRQKKNPKDIWALDKDKNEVRTTLFAKLFSLAAVKFSMLDSEGMGIEMDGGKPGWNDAMNGMPGLFGSGLSETIELYRIVEFLLGCIDYVETTQLFEEQHRFIDGIAQLLNKYGNKVSFEYWDEATTLRENYRQSVRYGTSGRYVDMSISKVQEILKCFKEVLLNGIKKAEKIGNGILPAFFAFEAVDFELGEADENGRQTLKVKKFSCRNVGLFLESSARALKCRGLIDQKAVQRIKASPLYDEKLKLYKVCAEIEREPHEIGRIRAFSAGWLERETCFLHMAYKYLLGLLRSGMNEEFYAECENAMVYNLDPRVYGRSILENSSFIATSCNPDKNKHGQGFYSRMTGANAEFLNIWQIMMFGENPFVFENNELIFRPAPKLNGKLFTNDGLVECTLLGKTRVIYHNEKRLNTYSPQAVIEKIVCDGLEIAGKELNYPLSEKVRKGEFSVIEIFITKK